MKKVLTTKKQMEIGRYYIDLTWKSLASTIAHFLNISSARSFSLSDNVVESSAYIQWAI